VQNHRHITGRRGEIIYYEIYTFQRRQGLPLTEQQLLQLLGEDTQEKQQEGTEVHTNPYEHKKMLDTYIAFHYGPSIFGIDNFPKACAQLCIGEAQKRGLQGRVLDLGCAVGRSTIELAQYFSEAVGLDYSNAFVEAAKKAALEQYPQLAGKTRFVVGDACNLDKSLGKFSLIFGGNLIDRLPDPAAFILSVADFLEPNGLLVLTSPYTWLAEYTAPEKWIGGIVEKGVEVSTPEGVGRLLLTVGVSECR
jgi:SAM-dependent methyltransferase